MRLIGVYDYTVILTYLGLISSVFGMTQAIHGDYKTAILCLALSGICDTFDGRIARTKKNRSEREKNFGIQLDSLCDVVCFGIFPALICYLLGVRGNLGLVLVFFYCLCAVIRLAFFNVLEGERQQTEGGCNKVYHGLPVTSMAFILPLAFPLRKPSLKMTLVLIGAVAATVAIIYSCTRFRLPKMDDETNLITEELIGELHETENP